MQESIASSRQLGSYSGGGGSGGATSVQPASNTVDDINSRLSSLSQDLSVLSGVGARAIWKLGRRPEAPSPVADTKEPDNTLDWITKLEGQLHDWRLALRLLDPNV